MVNVPKFHSLDIIFINISYPYFLSSYFFLIYTYVNLCCTEFCRTLYCRILLGYSFRLCSSKSFIWAVICQNLISVEGNGHWCRRPSSKRETLKYIICFTRSIVTFP